MLWIFRGKDMRTYDLNHIIDVFIADTGLSKIKFQEEYKIDRFQLRRIAVAARNALQKNEIEHEEVAMFCKNEFKDLYSIDVNLNNAQTVDNNGKKLDYGYESEIGIVQKLNDVTLNHTEQSEQIKKLAQMIAKYQNAIKTVDNKANYYQNSANRLHCPKELDVSRLESLTAEPTRKPLFNFIIENYEQISIEVNGKQKNSVVLKENIDTEILDKMGEVFKTLGYFEMNNIMKGKASEGIGKIKGMLE